MSNHKNFFKDHGFEFLFVDTWTASIFSKIDTVLERPDKNLLQLYTTSYENKESWTDISPWVLFTFYKLYKWYQIAQRTTYVYLQ